MKEEFYQPLKIEAWDREVEITSIIISKYGNNNLAIELMEGDEPYATLTKNLHDLGSKKCAYIDTNNCPWAPQFIEKYNLGTDTGLTERSGYCIYPLYEMNLEELEKYTA